MLTYILIDNIGKQKSVHLHNNKKANKLNTFVIFLSLFEVYSQFIFHSFDYINQFVTFHYPRLK